MRIRTIKPDFFRHGLLQDLEAANPGAYVMLVFAGLWGLSDKHGVFAAEPRRVKLDVLPFLEFDMKVTLGILEDAGLIELFTCDQGKPWGWVKSFEQHQNISGKEAQAASKNPAPPKKKPGTIPEPIQGSNREVTEKLPESQEKEREGKGREGEVSAHTHAREAEAVEVEIEVAEFFDDFEVDENDPVAVAPATPPTWAEVAREMAEFFTDAPEGISQWEMMEAAAGGRADPLRVCAAWAGKAPPIDLMNWRTRIGKLVTWVQTEVRTNPNTKKLENGHIISSDSFRRAVDLALAAD